MFNKDEFGKLLAKAQGKRSLNAYARECGVSSAYVSQLIRGLNKTAPSPTIIKKLADSAHNVSYGELMAAAGHISSLEEKEKIRQKKFYLLKENEIYLAYNPDLHEGYKDLTDEEIDELDEFIANASEDEINEMILSLNNIDDLMVLMQGDIEAEAIKPSNIIPVSEGLVKIPILGKIACGDPILTDENIIGYKNESSDNLPSGQIYYVEAIGDSMEPTIPNGSHVLIREQPEVEYGEIAAVLVNDDEEVTLKRVKKQGNLTMLVPDNPEHEPMIITKENPARILGRAIRYTQDL